MLNTSLTKRADENRRSQDVLFGHLAIKGVNDGTDKGFRLASQSRQCISSFPDNGNLVDVVRQSFSNQHWPVLVVVPNGVTGKNNNIGKIMMRHRKRIYRSYNKLAAC